MFFLPWSLFLCCKTKQFSSHLAWSMAIWKPHSSTLKPRFCGGEIPQFFEKVPYFWCNWGSMNLENSSGVRPGSRCHRKKKGETPFGWWFLALLKIWWNSWFPTYKTWWLVGLPGYIFIIYNSGNSPKTVNLWYLRWITSSLVNSWRWWWDDFGTPKKDGANQKIGEHHLLQIWETKSSEEKSLQNSRNRCFIGVKMWSTFTCLVFCQNDFQQEKNGWLRSL